MRIRKVFRAAAAGLVMLATVFTVQTPASAANGIYISVYPPSGGTPASVPMVLDMRDLSMNNGGRAQLWQKRTTGEYRNQRWLVTAKGSLQGYTYYQIKNELSQLCLDMATDVPHGSGVRVQQWECSSGWNQRWLAMPVETGNNWVQLINLAVTGLGPDRVCLDVTDVNYSNGALLQVWRCSGNWNQRWNIY
ncbi:RICIN domain-containing protein [Acrocarpospora catenulata]|uniref:RICIN domain-containing protein n=1 Tax=Acrocarpospora catenulata TaxID=2836182 RepID=UPI001BD94F11|nr:RICIN domain-containing protein [Acrocarpospora catenulata]